MSAPPPLSRAAKDGRWLLGLPLANPCSLPRWSLTSSSLIPLPFIRLAPSPGSLLRAARVQGVSPPRASPSDPSPLVAKNLRGLTSTPAPAGGRAPVLPLASLPELVCPRSRADSLAPASASAHCHAPSSPDAQSNWCP